jgi:Ribbon-helix-helix protein, copG family
MRPARFAAKVPPPPTALPPPNPVEPDPQTAKAAGRRGPRKCMFRLPTADAAYLRAQSVGSMRKLLIEWVAQYGQSVPVASNRFNEHRATLGLPPVQPPARRDEGELAPVQLSLQPAEVEAIDRLAAERNLTRSAFLTEVVRAAQSPALGSAASSDKM